MKTPMKADAQDRSIRVEQLRAGDTVDLERQDALVVMVENVDQRHVLVAYEGRDEIEYAIGTKLRIKTRSPIATAG